MIKFKLVPEPAWIKADHTDFDFTEIGGFSKEDRAKVRFKIAPFTPMVMKAIEDEKEKRKLQGEVVGTEKEEEKFSYKIVPKLLLDWDGILDTEGNAIPFSLDAAMKLFDGGYPALGGAIVSVSRKLTSRFDEYNAEKMDSITKN